MKLWVPYTSFLAVAGLSAFGAPIPSISLPAYAAMLVFIGLFYIAFKLFGWRNCAIAILILSTITAVSALLQMGEMLRPQAWFKSPNFLGGFAALCFFLCFAVRLSWKSTVIFAGANLLSLWLSQSRAAALGLICGLFFLTPKKYRIAFFGLPLAAVALSRWHEGRGGDVGGSARLYNWFAGIHEFTLRPFLGWGIASPHSTMFAHFYNIALDWLVTVGIVGFSVAVWAVLATFSCVKYLPEREKAPLMGLLTVYLVNGMLIYDTIGTSIVLMLALCRIASANCDVPDAPRFIHDNQALGSPGLATTVNGWCPRE